MKTLRLRWWVALVLLLVGIGLLVRSLSGYDPSARSVGGEGGLWCGIDIGAVIAGALLCAVGALVMQLIGKRIRAERRAEEERR